MFALGWIFDGHWFITTTYYIQWTRFFTRFQHNSLSYFYCLYGYISSNNAAFAHRWPSVAPSIACARYEITPSCS